MLFVVMKATLIILIGIYAMRASSVVFHREPFHPLMLVAALAFAVSLAAFHVPPTAPGAWSAVLALLCMVGVVANALLYARPDEAHGTPTSLTFSAVSVVGWAIVGVYSTLVAIGSLPPTV